MDNEEVCRFYRLRRLPQKKIRNPRSEEDDHAEYNEHGDDPPDDLGDLLCSFVKKETHMIDGKIITYAGIFAKERSSAFVLATCALGGPVYTRPLGHVWRVAYLPT